MLSDWILARGFFRLVSATLQISESAPVLAAGLGEMSMLQISDMLLEIHDSGTKFCDI